MKCRDGWFGLPLASRCAQGSPGHAPGLLLRPACKASYFISAMHFLTKAAFCSIGTFSRIARSSHVRIFLALFRGNIRSGAVDFMLDASNGEESQSMQSDRPMVAINACRMAAPDRGCMIARLRGPMQARHPRKCLAKPSARTYPMRCSLSTV